MHYRESSNVVFLKGVLMFYLEQSVLIFFPKATFTSKKDEVAEEKSLLLNLE